MNLNKKNMLFRRAPFRSAFSLPRPLFLFLSLSAACCLPPAAVFSQTELGIKDDLTVMGAAGTAADPDVEIKGFTVFGSTQTAYTGVVVGAGNVLVNGHLAVSSGAYFMGNSTFTGTLFLSNKPVISVSSMNLTAAGLTGSSPVLQIAGSTFTVNNDGKVGIGTPAPNTLLDVNGAIAIRKTDVTCADGENNDVNIGSATFVKLAGPTAAYSITGFTGGYDGRVLIVYNSAGFALTLTNDAGSAAANRIYTLGAVATTAQGAYTLIYDGTDQRWIVVGSQL